ncbi:hypothetical protein QO003_001833 [Arthrobacter silviterrae]|uniref:Uncharacterized protein n=1 Tax=Arthrobacter silviterrae TaxID=2026658 RepID=A0ABX0DEJ9_9MICC|nr:MULTISPECIES: hypothetical protein [Arthrobacter]MCU6479776.1 hypothetical protein [Arthrobacter sp. A2-55]MDQ0277530.1 hypothetical protein [Arthrobacter silviterrae]NGN85349.1 hypothetical protein [Arthrobacter silviterrae]
MEHSTSDAHIPVEPEQSSVMPAAHSAPFTIRWDRMAFAVVGVFALLMAGISGALNVFNMGSTALSWAGVGIFVAVLAGLRAVAVRDANRRRFAAATQQSSTPDAPSAVPSGAAVVQRETVLFDRVDGAEKAPAQKPLTAAELRNAALRVAAKGAEDAKVAHTQTLAEGELEAETWEPVEVPKPGYVTAARAAQATAGPLQLPEAPKSAGTSIKADQAGIGVPAPGDVPVAVAGPVEGAPEGAGEDAGTAAGGPAATAFASAAKPAKVAHALTNLDVVLQRRRA